MASLTHPKRPYLPAYLPMLGHSMRESVSTNENTTVDLCFYIENYLKTTETGYEILTKKANEVSATILQKCIRVKYSQRLNYAIVDYT